ncbi:hypothetical protein SEA_LAKES_69 [Mycobacterium phage Lakes]|uniref:Gene 64 protein n=5 Tax=Mycobacterium phage D29 TaxID=28369 RepID=VG64_BPMD2|nr:site-specific recombination directionality factor RDF [Mycobacterium phage D29]APC43117.1 hypothetical protein SEA_KERBEROS_69 [Mycobacterium phage Kerberos]AXH48930.1 hypothetical protein SEA_TOMATHAN_69 [Mycobacterium phage Tomathan]QFG08850.1 hypothetical protein SEA_NAJI_69 [Mycobacterium phage Naji]QUE26022.1 hypothetical protein SEA_LAKES_69 [Mycobacterium phage Lakes]UXE05483.1 hypothetical protein SEA_DUPLO_69 [Mycobacterium phage Duplo]
MTATNQKVAHMKKAIATAAIALAAGLGLVGCTSDADVASENLSKAADNFEIPRRIVFFNGITDKYLLEIQGRCSIEPDTGAQKLDVTCKQNGQFKKHFLGLSDNVTYFVEQIEGANVSDDFYQVNFKPQSILPDIELR